MKTEVVSMRLPGADADQLRADADACGMNLSDYLRDLVARRPRGGGTARCAHMSWANVQVAACFLCGPPPLPGWTMV